MTRKDKLLKQLLLKSLRTPLQPKSYRTTERRPKTRHPKHLPPTPQEPHVSEPNAFKVFSNVLRELRELNAIDRGRVMDAIEAELNGARLRTEPPPVVGAPGTEVISKAEHVDSRMDELLDVADAAKLAGVSRVALYGAISRGKVKADKSSGTVRVTRYDALAYAGHARPRKAKKK